MKKAIILIALALVISLAGCGDQNITMNGGDSAASNTGNDNSNRPTETTEQVPQAVAK